MDWQIQRFWKSSSAIQKCCLLFKTFATTKSLGPLYTNEGKISKKGAFSLAERRLLPMLVRSTPLYTSFKSWELELFTRRTMLRWHNPWWVQLEWLQQALGHSWQAFGRIPKLPRRWSESLRPHFMDPKPSSFQAFFGIHERYIV